MRSFELEFVPLPQIDMSRNIPHFLRWLQPWVLLSILAMTIVLAGCDSPEPVAIYTVPTHLPEQLQPPRERMLAAMVPQGEKVWFFKVTGPEEAISSIESAYRQFVESVEIRDGKPNLKELPAGWRLGAAKQMRVASIDVETPNKQLDISISTLTRQEDWDQMVLMNVNRWRDQLGLPSSQEKWAGGVALEASAADSDSVWVDFVGDPSAKPSVGRMSPPFAGGPPSPSGGPPAASNNAPRDPRLEYDRPEGWRDGRMTSMRMAAFNVGPESSQAELTIIPAGGDLRGNVARWLGEIRSDGVPDDIVDQALADAKEVDVDGRSSQRFLLTGDDVDRGDAIDVTIVPMEDGISLFVKMRGPVQTVTEQSDEITLFLESLKLNI